MPVTEFIYQYTEDYIKKKFKQELINVLVIYLQEMHIELMQIQPYILLPYE